ncbi:MAG TPA: hypothetical protein PKI86_07200 [Chitinophagales bacterium]|jgi:hypothetical protein|nr:hypothetical protein [Chitinophagales bacterium]
MKSSIIKIALSIVILLSSFGLQSCKKEATEIAPANKTIIGKWRAVNGNRTTEREFIKGADELHGSGNVKITTTSIGNSVTVSTAPFTWDISRNVLHINNIADVEFIFQISEDGSRMIFFDVVNRDQVSATFERIN